VHELDSQKDCATIQEDLHNDISNIQVSRQFEPDAHALAQFYGSDPAGRL